jgi:hypothetical protein
MADTTGKTPKEFANGVLHRVPWAANNRRDDPNERRLMELASLYVIMHSPTRRSDRTIRNCSLPSEVARKVPQARSHSFFIKDGNNAIVLVSPNDRRVADVIR